MSSANTSKAFLGAGRVYLDRITDGGASTGYLEPAELATLEIGESTELKTMTSKSHENYGQVLASVSVKQPAKLKLTLTEIDVDALALSLLGSVETATVAGGTVSTTPDTFTLIPGRWVKMGNQNITPHAAGTSDIVIATDVQAPATPAPVSLDDVEINHRLGLIKYTGSALTVPTAVTATYKHGGVTGRLITGSIQPQVRFRVLFDGKNLVTGEYVQVEIDEAICTPASPVDFMSDNFAELVLEGDMRVVGDAASPYRVYVIEG